MTGLEEVDGGVVVAVWGASVVWVASVVGGASRVDGAGARLVVAGALVVGAATALPVSPLMIDLAGRASFGVPARAASMNCCQMAPGSPDP